jgi:Asp-tRNA(Asn)/Glu-tRNA(Gln) amidotransferase A subunit family amidase
MSRRNYHGRVYAKAQNMRATYIKTYDTELAKVDVLVMPICVKTAPKNHTPGSYLKSVEDKPRGGELERFPQHPALQLHWPPGTRSSSRKIRSATSAP